MSEQYRFLASTAHGAYTVSEQTRAVLQLHGIKIDGLCAIPSFPPPRLASHPPTY